jgi:pimeloyl-ACP methyl ester carboxylesterase
MDMSADAPAYGRSPYPTDALRDGPHLGHIAGLEGMAKQHSDLIAAHLETLDGFGLRPTVEFFLEGSIDPDTVPAMTRSLDDALIVLDVDPDTGEDGAAIPWEWRYDEERHVISGSPVMGTQLREGTRYAAVLTSAVKSADGSPIFGAKELGLLDESPPARWKTTAEAYAHIKTFPALEGRITGITVFTTQRASDVLVAARNAIANVAVAPAPTLAFDDPAIVFDTPVKLDALLGQAARATSGSRSGQERWGTDNPTGMAHDHIAVVATGTTTIVRFVGEDTGTDGPEAETFTIGAGGVPVVHAIDTIPITIILPKGNVPADGFPVVIFGHGLGGSRTSALNLAEPLCAQGYAVVAIDMLNHGSRLSPADNGNNLASKPGFTGNKTLRDGFSDESGSTAYFAFFESFLNLSAMRDTIRQSALDFSRVAMLVQTKPSLAALAAPYSTTPKLDPTRVAYLGESFGTIVGADLAAIEPSIGFYVLDVAAGGIVDHAFPNSASIGDVAMNLAEQLYRTEGKLDRFHPLIGALQSIFDGADSLTFARHVLKDRFTIEGKVIARRHILVIEAMNDETVPNVSTEALARSFGLYLLKPNLVVPDGMLQVESPASANVGNQTAILVQYEPATHGYNWSAETGTLVYQPGYPFYGNETLYPKLATPIEVKEPIYETMAQVTEALSTYFGGDAPRIRSTQTPVADFDLDGKPDATDPAPYDPQL